jgi:WD40 repeat protein
MIIHNPLVLLIVALLSQLAMCLDHEKSYFIQDAASSVLIIGFYKDSLLIPSANDVVQKDIETGAFQRTFRVHTSQVETFAVIRNSTLITAGWDDLIAIWDLDTGSIIRRIRLRETDTFIKSLSIVGDQLYCGGLDSQIRQFSLADGRLVRQIGLISFET